jgi:FkbM family methyltransferase
MFRLANRYLEVHPRAFKVRTVFGAQLQGTTSDFIQRRVYLFGVWEPNLTHWIANRLEPGDTFVDVGANIGYYSLLASGLVGEGEIFAIEASPPIYAELLRHLHLNSTRNVRPINIAVSSHSGRTRLFLKQLESPGTTSMVEEEGASLQAETEMAPMTALFTKEAFSRIRLIKIDVEGAEWSVVKGLAELLEHSSLDLEILVEVNPKRIMLEGGTISELIAVFKQAGFHAYRIANDYSYEAYAKFRPQPVIALDDAIDDETEILFSRSGLADVQVSG